MIPHRPVTLFVAAILIWTGYLQWDNRRDDQRLEALIVRVDQQQQDFEAQQVEQLARIEAASLLASHANCEALNESREGQRRVLRAAVHTRYEVGDPNAAAFAREYEALIALYFQPRDCTAETVNP